MFADPVFALCNGRGIDVAAVPAGRAPGVDVPAGDELLAFEEANPRIARRIGLGP